jgi:hypothetical protein
MRTNRTRTLLAVAVPLLVVVVAVSGCGLAGGRPDSAGAGDLTPQPSVGATGAVPGQTSSPEPGAGSPAGGASGGGQPADPSAGPQIELFRVAQEPLCPRGTTQNPIEGRPVMLEWQVTGADQVTLSVDGPGAYGTYPAEGSETLSFGCSGGEGDRQRHTYQLTAVGNGQAVTGTLVVEAVAHEVADA